MSAVRLLDSGEGRKLEKFGPYIVSRPASQAIWARSLPQREWDKAHFTFLREGDKEWRCAPNLPREWTAELEGISFHLKLTDFGHLGLFPEHAVFWNWMQKKIRPGAKILNLFAYSGGATLAAAKAGASVVHLDSSKGMCTWARENAELSGLAEKPIRWIIEDVMKFIERQVRRGEKYEGIILDPPSFGRGSKGEVFKIEEAISPLLRSCRQLLSDEASFLLLSCHTPGYTPTVLSHLLMQVMEGFQGKIDEGEMFLSGEKDVLSLPSGSFARWEGR